MNSTDNQAQASRIERLLQFIGQKEYICDVGSQNARERTLLTVELQKCDGWQAMYEQVAGGVRTLLGKGTGGLIIVFPEEPRDYENLQSEHRKRHADVITAILASEIFSDRDRLENVLLAPKVPGFRAVPKDEQKRRALTALSAEGFLRELHCRSQLTRYPDVADIPALRSAVVHHLATSPDLIPLCKGRGLFAITLSSAFRDTETKEQERAKQRAHFSVENIPHPRYSPVTAMALNWHDEIARVLGTQTGENIGRKKVLAPYAIDPNCSLSQPYERVDELFEEWLNLKFMEEHLISLPPEMAEILKEVDMKAVQLVYGMQKGVLLARQDHLKERISFEELERKTLEVHQFIKGQIRDEIAMLDTLTRQALQLPDLITSGLPSGSADLETFMGQPLQLPEKISATPTNPADKKKRNHERGKLLQKKLRKKKKS